MRLFLRIHVHDKNLCNIIYQLHFLLHQILPYQFYRIYKLNFLLVFHINQILTLFPFSILHIFHSYDSLLLRQIFLLLELYGLPQALHKLIHIYLHIQVIKLNNHFLIAYQFFHLFLILKLHHVANVLVIHLMLHLITFYVLSLKLLYINLIFDQISSRINPCLH